MRTPSITTSFWIKQDASDFVDAYQTLFQLGDNVGHRIALSINNGADGVSNYFGVAFYDVDAANQNPATTPSILKSVASIQNWTHICLVVSVNIVRLYVNATKILDMSYNYNIDVSTTYNQNYLGYGTNGFVNGYMDEFRLYNFTLNDADVSALYNYVSNVSTSISVTNNNNAWRSTNLQGLRGYTNWQLSDVNGYVDASYNFGALVGFYNNQSTTD